MAQEYASSVMGAALRVTRLLSDGSLATGPSASYVLNSDFISLSFTPEYEEGDEHTQKIAICNPDPEFSEIIAGGTLLESAGQVVGYAPPPVGVDGNPYGSAIEVFSLALVNGKPSGANRYWRWVLPYAIMRPSGDRAIENGLLATTFTGWAVGNDEFDTGPDSANPWPFISDRPYQYARTNVAPVGSHGYVTYP